MSTPADQVGASTAALAPIHAMITIYVLEAEQRCARRPRSG
jgi:hypothetical protein